MTWPGENPATKALAEFIARERDALAAQKERETVAREEAMRARADRAEIRAWVTLGLTVVSVAAAVVTVVA